MVGFISSVFAAVATGILIFAAVFTLAIICKTW